MHMDLAKMNAYAKRLNRYGVGSSRVNEDDVAGEGSHCNGDPGMRRPRILVRTFLVIIAIVSAMVWWLSIQPRRRAKAIQATKQAGGYVQLDEEFRPEWQPKPS